MQSIPNNYPTRPNLFSRLLDRYFSLSLLAKVVIGVMFIGLVAGGLYFSLVSPAQIAMIARDTIPVSAPVTPPTTPTPSFAPTPPPNCQPGIEELTLSGQCGQGTFSSYSVTCQNGSIYPNISGDNQVCFSMDYFYQQAEQYCDNCIIPTPTPSLIPTPTPTSKPTPPPGCYEKVSTFCLFNRIGNCQTSFVCPTPTPTPTPPPGCQILETCYEGGDCKKILVCPSPSPTPSLCKSGITKMSPREQCGTGSYRYIDFECVGGFTETLGSSDSCNPLSTWEQYVSKVCYNKSTCDPAPTTVPTPPPSDCYYQDVKCFKEPCEPVLVCPSPTPTQYSPSPTPVSSPSSNPKIVEDPDTGFVTNIVVRVQNIYSTYLCRRSLQKTGLSWSETRSACAK